jgi:DNA-binding NarL/FixJ family response regulator
MSESFSVLLVTDNASTRDRLSDLLRQDHTPSCCSFADFERNASGVDLENLLGQVVVLDATTTEEAAIRTLRGLSKKQPSPKTVVVGDGPDLRLIARALVYRATRFATLAMPPAEWPRLLTEAWRGDRPTAESLMGRVRARLPVRRDLHSFTFPHGKELTLEEAIDECQKLGLSSDDIALQLRIDSSMIAAATTSAKGHKNKSLPDLGSLLGALTTRLPSSSSDDACNKTRTSRAVVGSLLAVICGCLAWIWLSQPSEHCLAGTVTFNEASLTCGLIRFQPVDGGRILAGEVREGRFSVKYSHGSHGGAYRVTVTGYTGEPVQVGPVVNPLGDRVFEETTLLESIPCDDTSIALAYAQAELEQLD